MPSIPLCPNNANLKCYPWRNAETEPAPQRTKRMHSWRASGAVLAILTAALLLNGCENKGAAEQAGTQVDEAARSMNDDADPINQVAPPQAGPVEETGKYPDDPMDDALPKQQNPAQ